MEDDGPSFCYGIKYPENLNTETILEFVTPNLPFHTKQIYDDELVKQIACKICGNTNFHIAQGSWLTVIRCVTCLWECGIHDG